MVLWGALRARLVVLVAGLGEGRELGRACVWVVVPLPCRDCPSSACSLSFLGCSCNPAAASF